MKFCRQTLFEAGRALFMNNSLKIYSRKRRRVLMVKVVLELISLHFKWPTKQNHRESLLLMALYCIYMRRITIQQQQTFLFLFNSKETFHFRMMFPKKL